MYVCLVPHRAVAALVPMLRFIHPLETSTGDTHDPGAMVRPALFETMHMRNLLTLLCVATFAPLLPWIAAAAAEPARAAATTLSLAQAERMAADLKQGMKLEEVQKLLGKPRRTALRHDGSSSSVPSQGTLQWTYSWGSSAPGSLQIEFAAKAPEEWYVNSWQWATY